MADSEYDYSSTISSPVSASPVYTGKQGLLKRKLGKGSPSSAGASTTGGAWDDSGSASPDSYHKGGMVRKSGMAKVHAGERVLTASQNRSYERGRRKRASK